jgi:hypothetical protein
MLPPTIIGADLGRRAAKSRQDDGDERVARVPNQRCGGHRRRRAERAQQLLVFVPRVFEHLARQSGDDRRHEHRLRDDHRRGREQEAELAERAGSREQQIHQQPDDHGRQAHQCVQRHEQHRPPRKTPNRECGAER